MDSLAHKQFIDGVKNILHMYIPSIQKTKEGYFFASELKGNVGEWKIKHWELFPSFNALL